VDIVIQSLVILLLLFANGVFAMAEIAVVTAKRSKLRALSEKGDAKARRALALAESPNRFLATVQVGITLVGIVAGAYGGASMGEKLAVYVRQIPVLAPYANVIAFSIIVLCITYLSLVIGELVPKRVGLSNPERIAGLVAGPMAALSRITGPLVSMLSASTEGLLKIFGLRDAPEATMTEDELKLMAREGLRVGVLQPAESKMVESVLALDKLEVQDLMTPRGKIIWVHENETHDRVWHKIVVSGHTTFPVYSKTRDQATGIISIKSIYANLAAGVPVRVKDLVIESLVVPESQNALALLETFKRTGRHMAIVVDEFGVVAGLVTLHDVMEAIIGEFPTMDKRLRPTAKRRDDGSWLIDAMIPIEEFEEAVKDFPLDPVETRDYETFGGLIIRRLGHIPTEGETFVCGPYIVEIIDMDHHRVDKALLLPRPAEKITSPDTSPA
jgi:putative hemolysin